MLIGIITGLLIGILTGIIFIILLRTAHGARIGNVSAVVTIVMQIAALPTFWFGGPWLTTTLLKGVDPAEMLNPYAMTLCITFVLLAGLPIIKLILQTAAELGREARP